jgi:hypothetical protein
VNSCVAARLTPGLTGRLTSDRPQVLWGTRASFLTGITRLTLGRTADFASVSAGGILSARCSGDWFSGAWPAAEMVVRVNCQSPCDGLLTPLVACGARDHAGGAPTNRQCGWLNSIGERPADQSSPNPRAAKETRRRSIRRISCRPAVMSVNTYCIPFDEEYCILMVSSTCGFRHRATTLRKGQGRRAAPPTRTASGPSGRVMHRHDLEVHTIGCITYYCERHHVGFRRSQRVADDYQRSKDHLQRSARLCGHDRRIPQRVILGSAQFYRYS